MESIKVGQDYKEKFFSHDFLGFPKAFWVGLAVTISYGLAFFYLHPPLP